MSTEPDTQEVLPEPATTLSQKEQLAKLRGILADLHGNDTKRKQMQNAPRPNTKGAANNRMNTHRKIG